MKQIFVMVIIVGLLFSCSGTSNKDPGSINTPSQNGDNVWTSSYARVEISSPFKYVDFKQKNDQAVDRTYYIYDGGDGVFLYIVELKMKHDRQFPPDYDPVLAKDQDRDNENLLEYSPRTYSLWKTMPQRSYRILKQMGIKIPKCFVLVDQAKLSPNLDGGVWIMMGFPSSCDYETIDHDKALNHYAYHVKLR